MTFLQQTFLTATVSTCNMLLKDVGQLHVIDFLSKKISLRLSLSDLMVMSDILSLIVRMSNTDINVLCSML